MDTLAEIIRTAGQLGLPPWQQFALTLVLAVLIVAGKGGVAALLRLKHRARRTGPAFPPTPGPGWDPEKGTGPVSPPMEMPPGGMPVPGPGNRWGKNEP